MSFSMLSFPLPTFEMCALLPGVLVMLCVCLMYNVFIVHFLREIKKQQLNELNLNLPHTEQVASLARPLYVVKLLTSRKYL